MLLKLDKWIIEIYGTRVNRFEVLVGNWFNGFIYLVNIYWDFEIWYSCVIFRGWGRELDKGFVIREFIYFNFFKDIVYE